MPDFDKDTYQTPQYLFNWLNKRFNFDVDGCANKDNYLAQHYIGLDREGDNDPVCLADDFLTFDAIDVLSAMLNDASELRIFANPPYSKPLPFVQRAAELKQSGHLVVMLLPFDKSAEWYSVIQQHATEVIDIIGYHDNQGDWHTGRIRFLNPVTGNEATGNNKGSMIAVFDPFVQGLVTRQVSLNFIKQWGQ